MVTVECPWCEASVTLARLDVVRCETCRIEVEIDPAPVAVAEVALAA